MGILDIFKRKENNNNENENATDNIIRDNDRDNSSGNSWNLTEEQLNEIKEKNQREAQLKFGWRQYVESKNNLDEKSLISGIEGQYGKNYLDDLDCGVLNYFNIQYQSGNLTQEAIEYMQDFDNIPEIIDQAKSNAMEQARSFGYNSTEARGFISFDIQEFINSKQAQEASLEDKEK